MKKFYLFNKIYIYLQRFYASSEIIITEHRPRNRLETAYCYIIFLYGQGADKADTKSQKLKWLIL